MPPRCPLLLHSWVVQIPLAKGASAAPHSSWDPSKPQKMGPCGCGLGSGSPLWCWGTGYTVRGCCSSWEPWQGQLLSIDKEDPVWEPGASMIIDTVQLIHGHDRALPLHQHEWTMREGRGEEERQDSRALGRTSLPLLRAPLAIQLGEILFRRAHNYGTFPPGTLSAAVPQRPGSCPWALFLDLETLSFHLEWPDGKGDDFSGLWIPCGNFGPSPPASPVHPPYQSRVSFSVVPPRCYREPGQQVCFSSPFLLAPCPAS